MHEEIRKFVKENHTGSWKDTLRQVKEKFTEGTCKPYCHLLDRAEFLEIEDIRSAYYQSNRNKQRKKDKAKASTHRNNKVRLSNQNHRTNSMIQVSNF